MNFEGEPIELNYKAFSPTLSILQSYKLSLYQACKWITLSPSFWAIMSHELNYYKTHNLAKHTHSEFQLVQLIKSLVVKRYLGFNLSRPFFRLKTCNNIVLDKILKEIILTLNFIVMTHDNLIPSSIYIKKTTNGITYTVRWKFSLTSVTSKQHHFVVYVKIKHCFYETNKCVDALARKGSNSSQDFIFFDSPPMDLHMLLFYDKSRLYYTIMRGCSPSLLCFC